MLKLAPDDDGGEHQLRAFPKILLIEAKGPPCLMFLPAKSCCLAAGLT